MDNIKLSISERRTFIKLIKRRVAKELSSQGITGKIRVVNDKSQAAAVAKHLAEQRASQAAKGRTTAVYPTTAEEQAEHYLANMLLSKKKASRKTMLSHVLESEIQRYATIYGLKGKARKRTETTELLQQIKKISPDAIFALARQQQLQKESRAKRNIPKKTG